MPPGTPLSLSSLGGEAVSEAVEVGELVDVVAADEEDVDVAVARETNEATSTENVLAEGLAEDSDVYVSLIRLCGTSPMGLSCDAMHTLI